MNKSINIAFYFCLALCLTNIYAQNLTNIYAQSQINILGATYGPQDVTEQVKNLYEQGQDIFASNGIFGDPVYGTLKVLTVVYENQQKVYTQTVMENQDDVDEIKFITDSNENQVFTILGASYGLRSVTQQVQKLIEESQQVEASSELFGDSLPGWNKYLTIIYYKNGQIFTKVINEGDVFRKENINILGATYGSQVVTDVVKSMLQEGKKITASSELFGDNMSGTTKFLVIVCEEDGKIQTKIIREGQLFYQGLQPKVKIIGAAYGSADVTEKVNEIYQISSSIQASNSIFGDPDFGIFKTLTITYQDNELGYITKVCQEHDSIQLP